MIYKDTIAGYFAYIIDEEKKVCKGIQTGLFFDNKFHQADISTGRIIIPFGRDTLTANAIIRYVFQIL